MCLIFSNVLFSFTEIVRTQIICVRSKLYASSSKRRFPYPTSKCDSPHAKYCVYTQDAIAYQLTRRNQSARRCCDAASILSVVASGPRTRPLIHNILQCLYILGLPSKHNIRSQCEQSSELFEIPAHMH